MKAWDGGKGLPVEGRLEDHEVGNGRFGWSREGDRRKEFLVLVEDHEVGNGWLGWWEGDTES